MPASIAEFREELAVIRKNGYAVARSEVDEGRIGLAVPVSLPEQGMAASLSLVLNDADTHENTERRLLLMLISSAALLLEQIGSPAPAEPPETRKLAVSPQNKGLRGKRRFKRPSRPHARPAAANTKTNSRTMKMRLRPNCGPPLAQAIASRMLRLWKAANDANMCAPGIRR